MAEKRRFGFLLFANVLLVLALIFCFTAMIAREYMRRRLRQAGVTPGSILEISNDLRNIEKYVELAKKQQYTLWPAFIAIVGMLGFVALLAFSVLLRGNLSQ